MPSTLTFQTKGDYFSRWWGGNLGTKNIQSNHNLMYDREIRPSIDVALFIPARVSAVGAGWSSIENQNLLPLNEHGVSTSSTLCSMA